MPTLTFNGNTYTVDHAVKGPSYVHGYDAHGNCVVALDGVTDFSGITYQGVYMSPDTCVDEPCNDMKLCNGKFVTRDGREVMVAVPTAKLDFSNFHNGSFRETLSNGNTITYNVEFDDNGAAPVRISSNNGGVIDIEWGSADGG